MDFSFFIISKILVAFHFDIHQIYDDKASLVPDITAWTSLQIAFDGPRFLCLLSSAHVFGFSVILF